MSRAALALLLLLPATAFAHTPSESFSELRWDDGRLTMHYTVQTREASRLPVAAQDRRLADSLLRHLLGTIRPEEGACDPPSAVLLPANAGWLRVELVWQCETEPQQVLISAFFDVAAEHNHYLRGVGSPAQAVLTADSRVWSKAESGRRTSALAHFRAGFSHIRIGYDHLAFLLALVLAFNGLKRVCIAVTGFTLGHAVSMLLLVDGTVAVRTDAVEALIAFSICVVALHGLRATPSDRATRAWLLCALLAFVGLWSILADGALGWLTASGILLAVLAGTGSGKKTRPLAAYGMVVVFGLLHGIGFAGGLDVSNIPREHLLPAVAFFNLGVEAGQIAFVLLAIALSSFVKASERPVLRHGVAATLFGFGAYWFTSASVFV